MQFPLSALERAMEVKEVIFRAISGEYTWLQAVEILGMGPRSPRWRYRMERQLAGVGSGSDADADR